MKTLQERMNDLTPYFRGIEVYNTALIVKVAFPSNWKYFKSADDRIKVAPSDDDPTIIYYYADSSDTTYEDLFDMIEETIKVNQDAILKLKLLKEKVEELRELFSNHTYDELQNLSFDLKKPTKRKGNGTRKKAKEEEPVKEEETEKTDPVENNEKIEKE
jgi:phosphoenolpyruvate carboxylase